MSSQTPADILDAAGPASCLELFWNAIADGQNDLAEEAVRRINLAELPLVSEDTFSFDEDEASGTPPAATAALGTSLSLTIEVQSPANVLSGWNLEKVVGLIRIDPAIMCLAKQDEGSKELDFRACRNSKKEVGPVDGYVECKKSVHGDAPGKQVPRLEVPDTMAVYAIDVPLSKESVKQKLVFSRPLFR